MAKSERRVVITGLGAVTALGPDVKTFWKNILDGKSGVKRIESFDTTDYPSKIGGEITDFNLDERVDKREAKRMDRFAQFALQASIQAVADSGLDMNAVNRERCGVIIGSGIGGLGELEREHRKMIERGPDRVSPFCVPKLMTNAASANVAIFFGMQGCNSCVVTACASGAHAAGAALEEIRNGRADVVLTGGSEAALTALGLASFCSLKALSRRNDDPEHASRPFDRDRDGFVLAEGAGVVVLEEYEHAKKRGAPIYAELAGFGMTCDASHITAPSEDGRGASAAITEALNDGGVTPDQVDYINAHGTSTTLNDISENNAIKKVFGDHAKQLAISSTKSHLGHLLGASGGVELVVCALAIRDGIMPPTINHDNPDPQCDLDYVPHTARQKDIRYATSNSFGFGGHNATLLLGKI